MKSEFFAWDKLDPENAMAARRSLLTFSIITFLVANLTFLSDRFLFFGFLIAVTQTELVALGRILSGIMLSAFLLKDLPNWIASISSIHSKRVQLKQTKEAMSLAENYGYHDEDYVNYDEFKEMQGNHETNLKRIIGNYQKTAFSFEALGTVILTIVLPIVIGLLAILQPYSLKALIQHLS
jgi:hypothetical protein